MRAQIAILGMCAALFAATGCKKAPSALGTNGAGGSGGTGGTGSTASTTGGNVSDMQGDGGLPPGHPPVDLPPTSRGPRRLDVDQLMATVATIANPDVPNPDAGVITWQYASSSSMLKTMGKPDYIYVTDEDLTPSTLYMKFIGDISNDVCSKMLSSAHRSDVLMKGVATNDTLQSNPTAVKAHMRWLYLRFFGRQVADTDDATIQPLLTVFDSVVQAASSPDAGLPSSTTPAEEGWRAVCIAAFTSPDFNLY